MNERRLNDFLFRIFLPAGFVFCCLYMLYNTVAQPGSISSYAYMAGLIFFQVLAVVLWNYGQRFFPFLMIVFLGAGLNLPIKAALSSGRWVVLAVGAVAGFTIYLKDRSYSFGVFHLVALFAVIAAMVSALVSASPRVAVLKVVSLLLMFLYGAAGARIAVRGREASFFAALLLGCEVLVYISGISYFILRHSLYGNPNSLGVVMGIVAAPVLVWGVIVSEGTQSRRRRMFALVLCLLLLLSSYARAAIGASAVSVFLLCIALRRYRLLAKGVGLAVLAALLVAAAAPFSGTHQDLQGNSLADSFLYKGKTDQGILVSRSKPWDETAAAIREHPWFGTGFGTSMTDETADPTRARDLSVESGSGSSREHGNSYLAILEWTGLLGVLPFYLLGILVTVNVGRVFIWLRRSGNPFVPAVPVAAILAAGLLHATFEDWMFAPGYYMCIFFWALAFVMVDILPNAEPDPAPAPSVSSYLSRPWDGFGPVIPGR